MSAPPITPETKVGDLLQAYPRLEATLVTMAPAFEKLKNPVLRRTVARVATLAQAARVGGVEVREMVRTLRREAGLEGGPAPEGEAATADVLEAPPTWFDEARVAVRLDADAILARGDHPLGSVQGAAAGLARDGQLLLSAGFFPAPLVDAMRLRGFETASFKGPGGRVLTVLRPVG